MKYLLDLYRETAAEAARKTIHSWPVIAGTCLILVLWQFSLSLLVPFGMLGGFIMAVLEAAFLTFYLGWMRASLLQQRVRFNDLKEFDWSLFNAVISVLFFLFVIQWALQMLTTGFDANWTLLILNLFFVVLINCLPEMLYISGYDGLHGVQESFSFVSRNWIEWYLPLLVVILPLIIAGPVPIAVIFGQMNVMIPASVFMQYPQLFILSPVPLIFMIPLLLVLSHFLMIFRGGLYRKLEGTNRRQRIFKGRAA